MPTRHSSVLTLVLLTLLLFVRIGNAQIAQTPSRLTPPATPAAPAATSSSAVAQSVGVTLLHLPAEEQYSLAKLKMQEELKTDLLSWFHERFWITAVVAIVVGFFGVRSYVGEMLASELRDARRAAADAQAATSQGRDAIKEVRAEASRYKDEVKELAAVATDVDARLRELSSRIDAEGMRVGAAAELKTSALEAQLAELLAIVSKLAAHTGRDIDALRQSDEKIAKIKTDASAEEEAFATNASYRVAVFGHGPGSRTQSIAKDIVTALSKRGFKASEGRWHPIAQEIKREPHIWYKPGAKGGAEVVASVVREVLGSRGEVPTFGLSEVEFHGNHDVSILF